MKRYADVSRKVYPVSKPASRGFTIIEVLIVMVIVAVGLTLAVPPYKSIVEKRQLVTAAEEIASFMNFAQSEAVKRNRNVTISMRRASHANWCLGAALGTTACDCAVSDTSSASFCAIDNVPYRLQQADVVDDPDFELMHRIQVNGDSKSAASFTYDSVRSTVASLETINIQMHTNEGSGRTRDFQLDVKVLPSGRVSICTDDSRKLLLSVYPEC